MVKGLSLFANVGIAETFLKDVGVDVVVANELLEERANFYRHLYPSCDMVQGDIKDSTVYDSVISKSKEKNVEFIHKFIVGCNFYPFFCIFECKTI